MKSPKNLIWATGGSVAINGALLALLVLTLPKAAVPAPDDTLWVSLETAAEAQTAGAPQPTPSPSVPPATSQSLSASTPPVPATADTVLPPQSPAEAPSQASPSESKPSTSPAPSPTATPAPTTPAQANAQPQAPATSGGSKHAASYAARVRAHIESFKVYPPQARRRHQAGVVGFTFTINRQGRVLSVQVTKTSGNSALDQAALDMLNAAQPLPRPPSDLAGETLRMTSSAEFGLRD